LRFRHAIYFFLRRHQSQDASKFKNSSREKMRPIIEETP